MFQLNDMPFGLQLDGQISIIVGEGLPGSGVNDSLATTVQQGSLYIRKGSITKVYQKITAGATTAAWLLLGNSDTEWLNSVLTQFDPTAALPASPTLGDRYLSTATANGWTANNVYEFNGTDWTETVPSTGTYVSVDDEPTVMYNFGGAAWVAKEFEATTASNGLLVVGRDVQVDPTLAGAALSFASGVLNVEVDDSTLEVVSDSLQIKALGVKASHIDFGTNAGQVSATNLPYDNTTSGLTASDTQSAIDEVEARLDSTETAVSDIQAELDTQTDSLDATAGSTIVAASVLVDEVRAVIWEVMLEDNAGNFEMQTIKAFHNGSADGSVDATDYRYTPSGRLRLGNVPQDAITVALNGDTGAAQALELSCSSSNQFTVRVVKTEVIKL